MTLPAGRASLLVERRHIRRRRYAVERHVDDGCDASSGGRQRGGVETLPLRSAGLVDVNVRVDKTRGNNEVACVDDFHVSRLSRHVVDAADVGYSSVDDVYRCRPVGAVDDDTTAAD